MPKTCATNKTTQPSKSAVPFILIVAPSGNTNPATAGRIPKSDWPTCIEVGNVALLDEVENAVTIIGIDRRKKSMGFRLAIVRSNIGYRTNN